MAKRFKLRISRVIQSCRSKDPSTLPQQHPVPSFLRPSPVNPISNLILDVDFPPLSTPHRSSFKRHMSSSFTSVGCGFGSKPSSRYATVDGFKWQKEEKWHVVAKVHDVTPRRKIYNTSASENDDVFPPPSAKTKRRTSKKKTTYKHRNSTSSADSELFSSEGGDEREEEERETLVSSSRSFSTDSSSEYNPQLKTITETPISIRQKKKKKNKNRGNRAKRTVSMFWNSPEMGSPARLSVFQKLIPCGVEGKVRESFAIVKKSEDPYEDFKRSMMDMILEKHMFEERDLEQMLQCYLSLNSINHHGVIVEAFSEIWDALFCRNSPIQ